MNLFELGAGELVAAALEELELVVDIAFGQKPQNTLGARLF